MAVITSQDFERAAELRARADNIKQRLVKIIRQAGLREGDIPPYPGRHAVNRCQTALCA